MRAMQISGNVGSDPQTRKTNNGTKIANFNVAVRQTSPDRNGKYGTDWVRCAVFGKRADTIERYYNKGDHVSLSGTWGVNEWVDKQGEKQFTLQLSVSDFDLPTGGHGSNQSSSNQRQASQNNDPFANSGDPIDVTDDDLPFD